MHQLSSEQDIGDLTMETETIKALSDIIADMFIEYPRDWVISAFEQAYIKAQTHHIELDACGKAVWVKNGMQVGRMENNR